MRRVLLGGIAALALHAAPVGAAGLPVFDATSNTSRVIEAARALQQAIQQYQQLQRTYQAIAHATDVSGVASALGGSVRTYMPEAGSMVGLLSGAGSTYGAADALRGIARYADVGEDTPFGKEMQRRELVTANAKAIAQAGMESSQDSITNLTSLLDRVSAAKDGTEVEAVGAAIAVENQNIGHHQAQIEQVRLMLESENRVEQQRADQMRWESARALSDSAQALEPIE
jgi:type IV secretion system protein VirB5